MPGIFDPSMFNGLPLSGLLSQLAGIQGPGGQGPMWGGNTGMSPQLARAYTMAGGDPGPGSPLPPAQGGVPLPMPDPRTAMASGGDPAAPMQPQQSMQQAAPQGGGGGILDSLQAFLGNHQNALMGLGAGIASGGLSRGLEQAVPGAQLDRQRQMQMYGMQGSIQALRAKGYSDADIITILSNPEAGKAAFGTAYGPDTSSLVNIKNPGTGVESSGILRSKSGYLTPAVPIPPGAIQKLQANRGNPQAITDFEAAFGPGSAAKALGVQ